MLNQYEDGAFRNSLSIQYREWFFYFVLIFSKSLLSFCILCLKYFIPHIHVFYSQVQLESVLLLTYMAFINTLHPFVCGVFYMAKNPQIEHHKSMLSARLPQDIINEALEEEEEQEEQELVACIADDPVSVREQVGPFKFSLLTCLLK